jgi:hypothetical protein
VTYRSPMHGRPQISVSSAGKEELTALSKRIICASARLLSCRLPLS